MASSLYESQFLHGLHDPGGESVMADKPGWIVHAISLQETRSMDYRYLADRGFGVICRINWGWHDHGSIPASHEYGKMADESQKFVKNTQGCNIFIIGNEFNRPEENRGHIVAPEQAAQCHRICYQAIKHVLPESKILIGAIAPWDNRSGDWLNYQARLISNVSENCEGYTLHAYTHGSDPALIYSLEQINGWYWHFRTYQQQMENIVSAHAPASKKEFHITEENQGDRGWVNQNSGYIKTAVNFLHDENQKSLQQGKPTVRSLSFYRWKNYSHDQWGMEHKSAVVDDFRSAVALGLPTTNTLSTSPLPIPIAGGGQDLVVAPPTPDLLWDPRLTARGVKILPAKEIDESEEYWKITKGLFLPEGDGKGTSGGRHHIYITALSPRGEVIGGIPFKVVWPTVEDPHKEHRDVTKNDDGLNGGNYPMSPSLRDYHVWIDDGRPSEILSGVGMGVEGNPAAHTSTLAEWTLVKYMDTSPASEYQYVIAPSGANIREGSSITSSIIGAVPYGDRIEITGAISGGWFPVSYKGIHGWTHESVISTNPNEPFESPPPSPQIPSEPLPPLPSGNGWERVKAFTQYWEGGFQNLQWDIGNWTGCEVGKGENKGTNWGISACSYPNLDIKNLTKREAEEIFFRDYWLASGADALSWPLNLLVFDTAVNFHPITAKKWLAESEGNPLHFIALRLRGYRKSKSWPQAGNAWVDRIIDLMVEASKL